MKRLELRLRGATVTEPSTVDMLADELRLSGDGLAVSSEASGLDYPY